MKEIIFKWQTLIGVFFGTFIPIIVSLFVYTFNKNKNFKRGLGVLEKILVHNINELFEAKEELELFIERIDELKISTKEARENEFRTIGVNFPLIRIDYDEKLRFTRTNSLYLVNKLLRIYSMLKSINLSLINFEEEFKLVIQRNHELITSSKITPKEQKEGLIRQLEAFKNVINGAIIDKNIPTAIKSMLVCRKYLLKYIKFPKLVRMRYEGFFRFKIKKKGAELVEEKFKEEVKKEYEKLISEYNKEKKSKNYF